MVPPAAASQPSGPDRHLKAWKDAMEGLQPEIGRTLGEGIAEAVLGGTIITVPDEGDRREVERRLVRAAQGGDLVAFERLYRDNERKVFALCLRLSCDPALAEELTQEVFVRAWRKLSGFRGESAFSSWLYPLTVNVALSERRSRRRRAARVVATDDPLALEPQPRAPAPERGFDLERALATLPPGARTVFVLHDVEGRTHEEIGALLNVAPGTSKAQLHRARRLLREVLE
jgi:RNA polymerase sigma-70 factor (ECF subfamily)